MCVLVLSPIMYDGTSRNELRLMRLASRGVIVSFVLAPTIADPSARKVSQSDNYNFQVAPPKMIMKKNEVLPGN